MTEPNEHMRQFTATPTVEELENEVYQLQQDLAFITRQRDEQGRNACELFDTVKSLQAEIERLKYEHDRMQRLATDRTNEAVRLEAEVELMRENVRMRDDIIRRQHKEIERLRAALRTIASHQMKAWGDEFQEGINSQAEIARAALEG